MLDSAAVCGQFQVWHCGGWVLIGSHCTGEKRLHAAVPLGCSALALGAMAVWLDIAPALAFGMLLVATLLWGPAGILSSLPATFLHVRLSLDSISSVCEARKVDIAPALAFGMLLVATLLWGPAGILSSLPATFLHVRLTVSCTSPSSGMPACKVRSCPAPPSPSHRACNGLVEMLLVATLLWRPAGILSSLPATFLHVRPAQRASVVYVRLSTGGHCARPCIWDAAGGHAAVGPCRAGILSSLPATFLHVRSVQRASVVHVRLSTGGHRTCTGFWDAGGGHAAVGPCRHPQQPVSNLPACATQI